MTPPTRTFAPPRQTPQDRAFDAVADGGSLVGATITPSTSSRPDAGNMQRTLGNLAVLKARGRRSQPVLTSLYQERQHKVGRQRSRRHQHPALTAT